MTARVRLALALLAGLLATALAIAASPAVAASAPAPGKLTYANRAGVWTSDSDGGNPHLVIAPRGSDYPGNPLWSHDGSMIAYVWGDASPSRSTWVANADGSDARFVTANVGAFWSPDDRRLVFVDRASDGGVGYVNVDGSGDGHLFFAPVGYGDGGGDFSPDGSRIVFARFANGSGRLYLVDTDGTDLERLTDPDNYSDGGDATWSPDGRRLLFTTQTGQNSVRITVVNADGTGRRVVRENATPWGWSLDGTQILFRDHSRDMPYVGDYTLSRMQADGSGVTTVAGPGQVWDVDWVSPPQSTAAVSAGGVHTVALGHDGLVRANGSNGLGQVGTGDLSEVRTPTVIPGLAPSRAVSGGVLHTVAVVDDGTVRAWGWNVYGQLGDGTTTDRRRPVSVTGLSSITSASAGLYHSLAVRSDGTVWAWGWNALGQLGDGTTTDRPKAVQVPGLTEVLAVAAGAYHSLALRSDGSVWAWATTARENWASVRAAAPSSLRR